jgi:hypothetical protein
LLPVITSDLGGITQTSERAPKGNGIIIEVVVNERHEPVAHAIVQAFSADATLRKAQARETVPSLKRASGSASTDAEGRFQISGLPSGEYLIAAQTPLFRSGDQTSTQAYATTFYPSTIDEQQAVRVSALDYPATNVQILLVPVRGARVSGSVVSPSGRPTGGLAVRLFHRFGDFGAESEVAVVDAKGTFEINSIVPWALGEIGDKRAIGPLLDVLDDESPALCVLAIYALETLHAREALPRLVSLLNDQRRSNFGAQVSVADAARAAIAKLR